VIGEALHCRSHAVITGVSRRFIAQCDWKQKPSSKRDSATGLSGMQLRVQLEGRIDCSRAVAYGAQRGYCYTLLLHQYSGTVTLTRLAGKV
jgi:hypothetical protein